MPCVFTAQSWTRHDQERLDGGGVSVLRGCCEHSATVPSQEVAALLLPPDAAFFDRAPPLHVNWHHSYHQ